MAQYLSEDLCIRVIGAIEGGMSRNGARALQSARSMLSTAATR